VTDYIIVIAPGAEGDMTAAFLWYRERSTLVADAFRSEVFAAIEKIAAMPLGNAADNEGNRRLILRRFPYSVIYEVRQRAVTLWAIAHHRRAPSYWR
jgi:toxin ParE1/3/4